MKSPRALLPPQCESSSETIQQAAHEFQKYLDHIPLARQDRILRRHGLAVTTQTLWDQLQALGMRLESASRALLAEPVVGPDQMIVTAARRQRRQVVPDKSDERTTGAIVRQE